MRSQLFTVVALLSALSCHGRLIQWNTTKVTPTTVEVTSPTRITRAALDEELTSFSKEDYHSSETAQPNSRRLKQPFSSRHNKEKTKSHRIPRDYAESNNEPSINKTGNNKQSSKLTTPLIKKPIPKFNEIDYDDDFQLKVIRSPLAFADSGDHEDEDFNLDDYDFDVNHDEYSGRGKFLEPLVKNKHLLEQQNLDQFEAETEHTVKPIPLPVIKIQSKLVVPTGDLSTKTDSDRHKHTKKAADKMKDDYYDEVAITRKRERESKRREIEEKIIEENDESKEIEKKSARIIRSFWSPDTYIDKLGEKTSLILTKTMSALPMFPQVPRSLEQSYPDMLLRHYNEPYLNRLSPGIYPL